MVTLLAYYLMTTFFAWAPREAWRSESREDHPDDHPRRHVHLRQQRIYALLAVIVISIGFYGFKGGIWSIVRGGAERAGPREQLHRRQYVLGLALNMVRRSSAILARDSNGSGQKRST
jgi:hypothetical protein